jgi:hypothetical protein
MFDYLFIIRLCDVMAWPDKLARTQRAMAQVQQQGNKRGAMTQAALEHGLSYGYLRNRVIGDVKVQYRSKEVP